MGIRCYCPNGHKLNIKEFLAGRMGICPHCGLKFPIPKESTRGVSKKRRGKKRREEPAAQAIPLAENHIPGPIAAETQTPTGPPGAAMPQPTGPPGAAMPQPSAPVIVPQDPPAMAPSTFPAGPAPDTAAVAAAVPVTPAAQPTEPETPDPLTEAGDVVWYVRPASGGQFGPANAEVMRNWISEGRVSADSLVWREGWRDWLEAVEVFPQLKAEPSPFALTGVSAAGPAPSAVAPTEASSSSFSRPRRRSTNTQAVIITTLILAVVVLAVVFILVLTGALGGGEARATGGPMLAAAVSERPVRASECVTAVCAIPRGGRS